MTDATGQRVADATCTDDLVHRKPELESPLPDDPVARGAARARMQGNRVFLREGEHCEKERRVRVGPTVGIVLGLLAVIPIVIFAATFDTGDCPIAGPCLE